MEKRRKNPVKKIPFGKKIKYLLDDFISKGFWAQFLLLAGTSISLTLLFGIAAMWLGEPNYEEGYWVSLMHMLDQGTITGDKEQSDAFLCFMLLVTIVGMAFTGTIVALINNALQGKLDELKKGHSGIIESNHTVILGFDANADTLCREIAETHRVAGRRVCLVIADDLPKDEMEHSAREFQQNQHQLFEKASGKQVMKKKKIRILFRSGDLVSDNTFSICAAEKAETIIINREDDSETIRILLALSAYLKRNHAYISDEAMPSVTALIHHEENLSAAKIAAGISFGDLRRDKKKNEYKVRILYSNNTLSSLFAQSCVNQGLPFVMDGLFNCRGASIYIEEPDAFDPELPHPFLGRTLKEIAAVTADAIPIGFFRKAAGESARALLKPEGAVRYTEEDLLIYLSETPELCLTAAVIPASVPAAATNVQPEAIPAFVPAAAAGVQPVGIPVSKATACDSIRHNFLLIGQTGTIPGIIANIRACCADAHSINVISADGSGAADGTGAADGGTSYGNGSTAGSASSYADGSPADSSAAGISIFPCEKPYDWSIVRQILESRPYWFDREDPRQLTNLVLLSPDNTGKLQADELVMVLLLNLRRYLKEKSCPEISITSEMHLPQNQLLVQTGSSNDFVIASEISNRMMAQIANDPRKYYVFEELLKQRSGRIELHPFSDFVDTDREFNLAGIFRAAASGHSHSGSAIPLGWIHIGSTEAQHIARLVLDPDAEELARIRAGSESYADYRLIVLTDGLHRDTES